MSAKDILLEVAAKLPPEATLNDAIYELEFRQAVQQGLDELDRGEGIPIEQVKAQIVSWVASNHRPVGPLRFGGQSKT
jgi:predicted transcriptional regulator